MTKKKSHKQRKIENMRKQEKFQQEKSRERNYTITSSPSIFELLQQGKQETTIPKPQIPETYIVAPAIRFIETDEVFSFRFITSHAEIIDELIRVFKQDNRIEDLVKYTQTEGFIDNHNVFHTRSSAGEIAYRAGQLLDNSQRQCLYSYGFRRITSPQED